MQIAGTPSFSSRFMEHGGRLGVQMRARNWSESPMGTPESWPVSLRATVRLLLHANFPMFIAWGPDLILLYNDAYAEILGDKHPAALGRRFADVWAEIWPDIGPIAAMAQNGEASFYENLPLTLRRKGYDETAWFTFTYAPLFDDTDGIGGMYCICTETTQQVLAEKSQTAEIVRLQELFEQVPGLIAVFRGPSHVFDIANAAYRDHVGPRELIGRPVRDALPEIEGQGFFELLDQVYATGKPHIGRGVSVMLRRTPEARLEERFVDFIYQPITGASGNVTGIFIEGSDVTESVLSNAAVRDSEQRLWQLANTIPHLAWMADADGSIHWYNDRWYEYTGTTPEQMLGWGWQSVHDPERLDGVMSEWKASVATGKPFESIFPLRAANGEFRSFYTLVAPLHDSSGTIVQWFGTNTDVTAHEKAREELRVANRRKDEFLAMLAHELRNPLAPISTSAELLKMGTLGPEGTRRTSEIIARQVGHMTELIDDLLDVSRVTRGLVALEKTTLSFNAILGDALEQVQSLLHARQQHVTWQVPQEPVFVDGDSTRLIQVVANILNNAAKYTQDRGHIGLRLDAHDDHAELVVEDDGIGIAADLLPHVFDLFTQAERSPDRAQGGLGLGLALARTLVELHGGSIAAASEGPGRGSRFTVRLPRVPAPPDAAGKSPGPASRGGIAPALRMMVVDDNSDAALTLCLLLETVGLSAVAIDSAQQAIDHARRASPELLFLDIGLPDMDGYELARRLRSMPETAHAVMVALTGYGQEEDRQRAMAAGFDHHLVKPVKLDAILALLAGAGKRARDPGA